jgi:hypothetical protein
VRTFRGQSPALSALLDKIGAQERETALERTAVPTISLNVIYRKVADQPFMGTVETSTSVGVLSNSVMGRYGKRKKLLRFWPFKRRKRQ